METAIFYITLDIDDAYSHVSMNLHQGESGRKISASFSQSSKPYPISEGCHAVFAGTVPGGQVFFNDCVIENECVICEIPAQITSLFGLVKAEIRLYGDRGSLIASPAFTINVVESAMEDGALLERIEATALTDLIGQAKEAVAECKSSVIDEVELSYQENGGEASAYAQLEENEDGRTLQFHFSNLKGEVGEQGPKGDKGDKGDKGETGNIGPAGKDGADCTPLALGAYVTPTAAGDIASFDDGADGIPVKSLAVDIEPVQNLNGYDAPWPPGGGKNILAPWFTTQTINGVTWTFNADGTFKASGTAVINSQPLSPSFSLPTGRYILSGCPSGGSGTTYYLRVLRYNGSTLIGDASDYGEGRNFTVTGEETDIKVFVSVNEGVTAPSGTWKPMIRLATETDASYSPYSNICPISGWTGAKVTRTGNNFLDPQEVTSMGITFSSDADGYITASPNNADDRGWSFSASQYKLFLPAGIYRVYADVLTPSTRQTAGFRVSTADNAQLYMRSGIFTETGISKIASFNLGAGGVVGVMIKLFDAKVRFWIARDESPADYEPYRGNTYDISFPDEAGTVYGGTLNVISGVLTVDRRCVVMNSLTWKFWSTSTVQYVYTTVADKISPGINTPQYPLICSKLPYGGAVGTIDFVDGKIYQANNQNLYITDNRFSKVEDFMPVYGDSQIVYFLATPITYQLTPTEVNTLLGVNNVYSDTGDTEVTYRADPTLIYNKLAAAIISSGA